MLAPYTGYEVTHRVALCPILRAGIGLVDCTPDRSIDYAHSA